jgi:hypothetical protein
VHKIKNVLLEIKDANLSQMKYDNKNHMVIKLTETKTRDVEIFLNYRMIKDDSKMNVEELYYAKLN